MIRPLVSVVVPLYNYAKYIKYCIKSILKQDYDNFELIVVDDCSTDDSCKVAKRYECDKVKILKMSKNSGYSAAKNEGIIVSKGEFITCLDADDMFTKNSISSRMNAIFEYGVPFVHANAINVYGDCSLKQAYAIPKKKITRTKARIHAQSVLMARWVHQKYGLYDEKLRARSDKEIWWRLFGKYDSNDNGKIKKVFIEKDVAYYRQHTKSMMSMRRKNKKYDKNIAKILHQQYELRKKEGITKENTRFLYK